MINLDVTKISSKGQIVIPVSMRRDFKEGDNLIVIKDGDRIILKKIENLTEKMKEDLEFARRTEEAWGIIRQESRLLGVSAGTPSGTNANAGSVVGTNAPYVQYLVCVKD